LIIAYKETKINVFVKSIYKMALWRVLE